MLARLVPLWTLSLLALACTPKTEPSQAPDDSGAVLDSAEPSDDTSAPDSAEPTDDSAEPADDSSEPTDDSADTGELDTGEPQSGHSTEPPEWPTYSEGACPTLVSASTSEASVNTGFFSGGLEREFRLLVPSSYDGSSPMPLVVGWHWLGASSSSFVRDGEIEAAIEEQDFIAVFPDSITDQYLFDWPFFETYGADVEHLFLDDLLACIGEQYNIDPYQVHGAGVSAGALWLTYVSTTEHIDRFASVMSLSGGLGAAFGVWEMAWVPQDRKFPAFVLNGGETDWLAVDFHVASERYVSELRAEGHFVVACEHDQGHAMPPFEESEQASLFNGLWSFMFDHPYDLEAGASPYLDEGLPEALPEWCWVAE